MAFGLTGQVIPVKAVPDLGLRLGTLQELLQSGGASGSQMFVPDTAGMPLPPSSSAAVPGQPGWSKAASAAFMRASLAAHKHRTELGGTQVCLACPSPTGQQNSTPAPKAEEAKARVQFSRSCWGNGH